jgi:uncharacterized protein YpmB
LKKEEIKEAENTKNQLKNIEKIFQKLRMQQKKPYQKPNIKTIDELYELLNKEVYYTTKGTHKRKKTKIVDITSDRKIIKSLYKWKWIIIATNQNLGLLQHSKVLKKM